MLHLLGRERLRVLHDSGREWNDFVEHLDDAVIRSLQGRVWCWFLTRHFSCPCALLALGEDFIDDEVNASPLRLLFLLVFFRDQEIAVGLCNVPSAMRAHEAGAWCGDYD